MSEYDPKLVTEAIRSRLAGADARASQAQAALESFRAEIKGAMREAVETFKGDADQIRLNMEDFAAEVQRKIEERFSRLEHIAQEADENRRALEGLTSAILDGVEGGGANVPALPAPVTSTASPVQIVTFEHLSELREEFGALTDRVDRIERVRESGVDDATARRLDQQNASIDDLYSKFDQIVALLNSNEERADIAQAGEFDPLRPQLVGAADPDTRDRIQFLTHGHVFVAATVSAIEKELAVLRAGLEPDLANEMSQESDRVYQEELRNNAAEVGIPIKEKEGGDESI